LLVTTDEDSANRDSRHRIANIARRVLKRFSVELVDAASPSEVRRNGPGSFVVVVTARDWEAVPSLVAAARAASPHSRIVVCYWQFRAMCAQRAHHAGSTAMLRSSSLEADLPSVLLEAIHRLDWLPVVKLRDEMYERIAAAHGDDEARLQGYPPTSSAIRPLDEVLDEAADCAVRGALRSTGGSIRPAARLLGISHQALYRLMKRHRIRAGASAVVRRMDDQSYAFCSCALPCVTHLS